jgi:hypothetical protein
MYNVATKNAVTKSTNRLFIFVIFQQPQQFGSMIKYLNGWAQKLQIKHTDIALERSRYTPIDFHLAIEIDLEKFSIEFQ